MEIAMSQPFSSQSCAADTPLIHAWGGSRALLSSLDMDIQWLYTFRVEQARCEGTPLLA